MGIGLAPATQRRTINGIRGKGPTLKLDRQNIWLTVKAGRRVIPPATTRAVPPYGYVLVPTAAQHTPHPYGGGVCGLVHSDAAHHLHFTVHCAHQHSTRRWRAKTRARAASLPRRRGAPAGQLSLGWLRSRPPQVIR